MFGIRPGKQENINLQQWVTLPYIYLKITSVLVFYLQQQVLPCDKTREERDQFEDKDIDGRNILKWFLNKYDGRAWTGLTL
jgi:hypothetical protein